MRKILVLLFTIYCGHFSSLAQAPFFQQYDLLRKNQVTHISSLHQDKEGFIWVGSDKGLFKLDGSSAQHFQDTVANRFVTAMANDSLGRLWLGYNTGAIRILRNGTFEDFLPEEGNSNMPISAILFDRRGVLWFSTLNDGLYYYRSNRLYRLDGQEGFPDLYVYHITEDLQGRIVASTDRGIAICSVAEDNKVSIRVINSSEGLPDNIVKKTLCDTQGRLWLATEEKGIFIYDEKLKSFHAVVPEWSHGSISDFVVSSNEVWVATSESALLVWNIDRSGLQLLSDKNADGLSSVKILLRDLEGNIWSGSRKNLLRTHGTSLQFFDADQRNTLAVTVDAAGDIWYSNADGLFRLRSVSGVIENVLTNKSQFKTSVISLYTDHLGFIWAGLYGEGVLRIDPSSLKITRFHEQLRNANVLSITGDSKSIWLATLGGASRITNDGSANFAVENFGRHNGLSSDFIYQVFVDRKGRAWFATDGDGVDMFDGKQFRNFRNGLPSTVVYAVTEDGNGKIWVNVQGSGVYAFDDKENFINPFPGEMRHNDIFTLNADNDGNLILSHELGIDVIDTKRNKIKFLGEESGLKDRTCNLNAAGKNSRGVLYFGTTKGIIRFADGNEFLKSAPLARIRSVKVYDTVADISALQSLAHDENNLTINFTGLWFRSPNDLQYYYKLENYDRDWITSKNTSVTYSKLPPGEYVFKVKVADSGNLPLDDGASIVIAIAPPFWKRIWFYGLCLVAAVVIGYVFIHYRERRLIRDKLILEARVKRRTLEIQRQNDEIQAQNEEIMAQAEEIRGINENLELLVRERTTELERKNKALEEYAFINAHKLRSPVASILGLVNLITRTQLDSEGSEITKRLKQSADELDDIVRSITKAIEKGDKETPIRHQ